MPARASLLLISAAAARAAAARAAPAALRPYAARFEAWRRRYNVSCCATDEEYARRLRVWADTDAEIAAHNRGGHAWRMGHNARSHLTRSEISAGHGLQGMPTRPLGARVHLITPGAVLPTEVDWRKKGAVSPVKNQGSCGSCWAFSTAGSMDGAYAVRHGELSSARGFSEQMLIDCDTKKVPNTTDTGGNSGCHGGRQDFAYHWLEANGGLCTEEDYPYTASDGRCTRACTPVRGSTPAAFTYVAGSKDGVATAAELMSAVAQQPVAVVANGDAFSRYASGVITSGCPSSCDHAVLVVGYGVDVGVECDVPPAKGCPYWLVKDSYGTDHADHGYVRVQREGWPAQWAGMCGILTMPLYPALPAGPAPPGPPAPPARYHCDPSTHQCIEQASGHSTVDKCRAACGA